MPPATSVQPGEPERLQHERDALRRGLWQCYAIAGGDTEHYTLETLDSEELVALVVDCVQDLRGFFDAARRDLR